MTLRPVLSHPPHVHAGERVAVLSPSWAGPAVYPHVHDLGLQRLRDELGLEPVEYPTTRRLGASPQERARDIEAAFADPDIRAVMASIGGSDQILVLRHLDPEVLRANPKPFFGYSDNTNLLIYLWNLGIVGYHGGSTLVHLGRPGRLHPATLDSLRRALFDHGLPVEVTPAKDFSDENGDWAQQTAGTPEPVMREATGWTWRGAARSVKGPSWGGCLEILDFHLRAGRYLLDPHAYAGCVLLLETSEELPSAEYVRRVLLGMGERGMLGQFVAVVVAAPKAWSLEQRTSPAEREAYTNAQREAVAGVLDDYNPGVPAVFGVEFGHTDPQVVMPYGGEVMVDGAERRLFVTY
jgi:muramoyltetrapeptide carboxypeptidase LdcA involved in peptidoglycan recycling